MTTIIQVKDLWWRYSQETDWVLRGVDFEILAGETIAVVGPTGAGKTTLLSFIQSLLPHAFPQGEMKGNVLVDGLDTRKVRAAQLVGRVGMVFEDAEAQFVFPTVEDDLAFGLESLNLDLDDIKGRLERVVKEFGLEDLMGRTAGELSGGEKQRVSIAGLLAIRPKVLLLDEPTSELDPTGKREIMGMVRKIRSESEMTLVIVEQDLEEIATFADRFLLLDQGKMLRAGKPLDFFSDPSLLLAHGVYPPEVSLIFGPLLKAGRVSKIPLSASEATEEVLGGR